MVQHDAESGGDLPDNYRYTFFAYYPMDDFTVESPTNATTRGVPKLTFTMPFAETGDVATTTLDDKETPDAMVSVVYNHLRTTGNVRFNFSHIMTGLGFAVNNYNYGEMMKLLPSSALPCRATSLARLP
ncbi:fimbrillin family protein [Bacteroides sp. CR5/BHMF/2]|nr:fimbrillin family protein [Bacteroides sp. CR5/BHMF/2]